VFKTYTGNREVYSVMYGEFTTRRAAINAIDGLPKGLRDTSPLGRSVGGIWQEIRRLESKN
jgi:septal ring-binding cell division protein DamX